MPLPLPPFLMPERRILRAFPPPYNEEISPYSSVRDFSKLIRYEMERRRFKALRPCKVIFVGDVAVGKTTIVHRFCYDKFQSNYKATIGVDFEIENFNILGQHYSLEMWDTAGQERFKCIAQAYYRNANVIVVAYDMSKPNTLQSAMTWLRSALTVNSIQKPFIFLVGTKSDLLTREEFVRVEKLAGDVAEGIKAEYWSVSARTGFKVIELFQRVAALSFESAMKDAIMEREYKERECKELSIDVQMLKKSHNFDFGNNLQHRKPAQQSNTCLC